MRLEIHGADGIPFGVNAKLDTGFDGDIALPNIKFKKLDTSPSNKKRVALADGTEKWGDSCLATVKMGEQEEEATILDFGNSKQALLGMQILMGYSIRIDARPYGKIRIVPMDDV